MNPGAGLKAYPRLAEAQAELEAGRAESANAIAIQHLREHRGEPRGLALLGAIALRGGALVQAEQFLRQAMAAGLTSFEVQRDLASAINQQERSGEALRAFSYLADQVAEPQLRATKALIPDKLGRTSEALTEHELVIAQGGQRPEPWISYGNNLRAGGRIDDAIAAYRRATAIEPEHGEAWWALANIKSRVLNDADIGVMEQALAGAVDLRNVVPLHFALGRAYHDRDDHAAAFEHCTRCNDLRAGTIGYRREELTAEVDEFIARFGPAFFERPLPAQREGPIPVFVISLPRSGSTLLEQMLDCHSRIEAVGELPYIRALLRSAMEIHTRSGSLKVPDLADLAPGLVHHVDYVQLVEAPKQSLSAVLDYLDLDWEEPLLSFHESDRAVRTPSAEQVRRPLNRSGFGASEPYAQWLRPLRDALGPLADS